MCQSCFRFRRIRYSWSLRTWKWPGCRRTSSWKRDNRQPNIKIRFALLVWNLFKNRFHDKIRQKYSKRENHQPNFKMKFELFMWCSIKGEVFITRFGRNSRFWYLPEKAILLSQFETSFGFHGIRLACHLFWQFANVNSVLLRHPVNRTPLDAFCHGRKVIVVALAAAEEEYSAGLSDRVEVVPRPLRPTRPDNFARLLARTLNFKVLRMDGSNI